MRWLLVAVSTAGASSTLRVYVWRKLREMGGFYLQQQVCVLPDRPETNRVVGRVVKRVEEEGGEATLLHVAVPAEEETWLLGRFNAEREDEYGELLSRIPELHVELETERGRGRATFTEVDESRADLERFEKWLGRIRKRDYFESPSSRKAAEAVARARELVDEFETEAVDAELSGRSSPDRQSPVPSRFEDAEEEAQA